MARMGLSVLLSSPVSAVPSGADLWGGGERTGPIVPHLCNRRGTSHALEMHSRVLRHHTQGTAVWQRTISSTSIRGIDGR